MSSAQISAQISAPGSASISDSNSDSISASSPAEKIVVLKPFLPASARRSYHVYCELGDELLVEKEYDHGTMCRKNGVICFLLEEEIYKFCRRESAPPILSSGQK